MLTSRVVLYTLVYLVIHSGNYSVLLAVNLYLIKSDIFSIKKYLE